MLIAAAEQHNHLPPPNEADETNTIELCEGSVIEIKEEDVTNNSEVYCTNDGIEQLIILGPNGERYHVADFQMWH
jgi:hypothetical protein